MTAGWTGYALAFVAFVLAHAVPARAPIRSRLTARLGERAYLWLYSAVSIALLYWLIVAARRAPYVPLWPTAAWQAWLANLVMPLVVLLAAVSIGRPNPFSFGGGSGAYDPDRPGITGLSRHPLLLGIVLWAALHMLANGDLAHLLLFGSFAISGMLGMAMLDRRRQRSWGPTVFAERSRNTSLWPGSAWLDGRARPRLDLRPVRRLVIAVAIYGLLLWLHPLLLGVSPLPPH